MKVQWWYCTTAPNSACERSSAQKKLAPLSLCCSDVHWRGGGHILLLCTPELLIGWRFSSVDEGPKGRVFYIFTCFFLSLIFLSINIHLLWTQRYLCQYEESSGRTFLGRGESAPWRNCWGTMDSMDWLLLSKRVNVVCVFVQVCHPKSIVMKTTASIFYFDFFFFIVTTPHPAFGQTHTREVLYSAEA